MGNVVPSLYFTKLLGVCRDHLVPKDGFVSLFMTSYHYKVTKRLKCPFAESGRLKCRIEIFLHYYLK